MRIHEADQGSTEWLYARCGIPTASRFGDILTEKTLKLSTGKSARSYLHQLVAERLLGGPIEIVSADWMERGTRMEPEARAWYELERDVEVVECGLVLSDDGKRGASPDGLIEDDPDGPGGLEIKNLGPKAHVEVLLGGDPPGLMQSNGLMLVTGRAWWDVLCYSIEPALPPTLIRRRRNAALQAKLDEALGVFERSIDAAEETVRAMGSAGRRDDGLAELLRWSLVHGKAKEDEEALSLDEINALRIDLGAAVAAGHFDHGDRDAVLDDAVSGNWDDVRTMWAHVRKVLG